MKRKQGFALILALLLTTLLLVLGMAFLSKQSHRYRLARLSADAVIAKNLAYAGMENTRAKIEHDLLFPPPDERYHDEYSYREEVTDLADPRVVGHYDVTIDRRWMDPPFQVIVIISEGRPVDSFAIYRIRGELDVSDHVSRNRYRFIRWEENGVY